MENKISVIVPVYKVEHYLHRCVDSIINQTYQNLEIILVNDGSPDNSGSICDDYALKDNRIIVIHNINQGISCARNSGIDIATGTYITFVDSDDHLDVTMYEKMMLNLIQFELDVIEVSPSRVNDNKKYDHSLIIESPIEASKRIIESTAFSVWRRIFKKSAVENIKFIPGLIHQDVFYTIDMLKNIEKHGFLNSPLYYYNTENISVIRSEYTLRKIETGIRATEYIKGNIINSPILRETLSNYVSRYYTDHYFLLSRNIHLDTNRKFRKKLRKSIKHSTHCKNYSMRSIMVIYLPFKLMEYISSSYNKLTLR